MDACPTVLRGLQHIDNMSTRILPIVGVFLCVNWKHWAVAPRKKNNKTYSLTPWSRVLPEKLKRPELLKKFPAFMEPEDS
jgi:hypothetical protein